MEKESFWTSDPVLFVKRHQDAGFKFTSEDRTLADSRLDGGVAWYGHEVYESRVAFGEKGGIDRVEIQLFNRGGTERIETLIGADGQRVHRRARVEKMISEADFHALIKAVQVKLTGEDAKVPAVEKSRVKNTAIRQFAQTWSEADVGTVATLTWTYSKGAKKTDPFSPGYIRLAVDSPSRAAQGRSSAVRKSVSGSARSRKLSENVHPKDARGDVYVDNIPMVDQGAKGYCAAAASERILRYFGTDVDEHEIGMAAGTTAARGTSTDAMVQTVTRLGKRYRFAVQTVAGDAGESVETRIANLAKHVERYNKTAKRLKKPQIEESVWVSRNGSSVTYHPDAAAAAMDPEVLKEMKTNGAGKAKCQAFLKTVRKNVDAGQPLLWGVTLGIYPESDLPQARGGHMRLIIGYNDKKGEILYSDSWGQGHELKRMPADWAWTITDTVLAVRPL